MTSHDRARMASRSAAEQPRGLPRGERSGCPLAGSEANNSFEQRHPDRLAADEQLLTGLLAHVRGHFYSSKPPAVFHRERRRLLHALCWPAHWLDHRGLFCSPARYRTLLLARIDNIRGHGDPACYGPYFPTYLLKCLQEFFDRHDEELHAEFRHVRNALDAVLGSLRFAEKITAQSRQIAALASVHRLLRTKIPTDDPAQMPLF